MWYRWLPALLIVAACGGAATPKVAPTPTVNTQAAGDEARVACRFFTPDSADPEQAQKFVDHAFTAAQMDARWQGLSDAATAVQAAEKARQFAELVTAIQQADDACKEVP